MKANVLGLVMAFMISTAAPAVEAATIWNTSHKATAATIIKGRIDPIDAAVEVWAISGTDTLKVGITDGGFTINVKPGIYKVVIVAKVPYKDVIKDDVQVADGNTTDIGTIKLQQ
jgi:hypothetical protein